MPYEVEYLRNGVKETFITKDKYKAEQCAIDNHGVVFELVRIECLNKLSPPLCMISEVESLQQDKTATQKPTQ